MDPVCSNYSHVNIIISRLFTAFYFENLIYLFPLKKGDNGSVVADWPLLWSDGPLGGYAVEDTGAYVVEAFKKPDQWIGRPEKFFRP